MPRARLQPGFASCAPSRGLALPRGPRAPSGAFRPLLPESGLVPCPRQRVAHRVLGMPRARLQPGFASCAPSRGLALPRGPGHREGPAPGPQRAFHPLHPEPGLVPCPQQRVAGRVLGMPHARLSAAPNPGGGYASCTPSRAWPPAPSATRRPPRTRHASCPAASSRAAPHAPQAAHALPRGSTPGPGGGFASCSLPDLGARPPAPPSLPGVSSRRIDLHHGRLTPDAFRSIPEVPSVRCRHVPSDTESRSCPARRPSSVVPARVLPRGW